MGVPIKEDRSNLFDIANNQAHYALYCLLSLHIALFYSLLLTDILAVKP
ncbi:hypothetical protein HMPREF0693_2499 [Proteus mirabilis ATCC 29906]|nr:hypothetical protein HMPREF0693_2499 [Proteus mirabilis ATCC 29906]PVF71601.1 hypothetical protein CSC14_0930 [Proteus mirabilis]